MYMCMSCCCCCCCMLLLLLSQEGLRVCVHASTQCAMSRHCPVPSSRPSLSLRQATYLDRERACPATQLETRGPPAFLVSGNFHPAFRVRADFVNSELERTQPPRRLWKARTAKTNERWRQEKRRCPSPKVLVAPPLTSTLMLRPPGRPESVDGPPASSCPAPTTVLTYPSINPL